MSIENQYTKYQETSLQGFPAGEATINVEDLSVIGSTKDITLHDPFSLGAVRGSCQVVAKSLTGTLNGTVDLIQSNDGENWDLVGAQTTLSSANGSDTIETNAFSGKFLGVRVTKGGLTGGSLKLVFIIKGQ